jgi:tellurium resistance protein TerD
MAEAPQQEQVIVAKDSLHMSKGEEVVLSREASALRLVTVGLGWNAPEQDKGSAVDIDASAFMLGREGRVRNDLDFVFYNNLETPEGCIQHGGDNTTGDGDGDGEGDDEVIRVDLDKVPFDVEKIAFAVTIHNAEERQQSFGVVKGAYMRILNESTGAEMAHYDLSEDAENDNAMIFGELVRDGMGWKFKAIGTGSCGGLYKIARDYGVNVAPA